MKNFSRDLKRHARKKISYEKTKQMNALTNEENPSYHK